MSEFRFFKYAESATLQKWHRWLENNRGDRARLRRAERPEDILLTDAFFNFLQQMPENWRKETPLFTSAAVAGLISHVKEDRKTLSRLYQPKDKKKPESMASLAEQMATPVKGEKKAPVSELRFQQLQKSRTTGDFYHSLIKVIRLLNGRVNITSLANDIIHWHREFENQVDRKPANRLAVYWATDYFTTLQIKKRS